MLTDPLESYRLKKVDVRRHLPMDFDMDRFRDLYSQAYLEIFQKVVARQLEEWHREYNAGRDTSGYSAKRVLAKTHSLAQMCAAELAGARYMGATKAVWRDPLRGTGLLSGDQVTAFQSVLTDLTPTSNSLFSQAVRASAPQEWAAEWASKKPPSL